jgi:DNA-directed RNA polymerase subunit RPC12/RpoP
LDRLIGVRPGLANNESRPTRRCPGSALSPTTMPIHFSCTCGKGFRAAEGAAGKRVRCPKCGSIIVVPQSQPADDSATEDDLGPRSGESTSGSDEEFSSAVAGMKGSLSYSAESAEPRPAGHSRPFFEESAKQLPAQRSKQRATGKSSTSLWTIAIGFCSSHSFPWPSASCMKKKTRSSA